MPPRDTEKDPRQAFGQSVRDARAKMKMSQDRLAELSNLDRAYVGRVERGETNVTLATMIRISDALRSKPSWLLDRAEL